MPREAPARLDEFAEAAAALDGFGHVGRADAAGLVHVGDCTRDFEDAMVTAGRQAQALDGGAEQLAAGGVGLAPVFDLAAGEACVGLALAGVLDRPAARDPLAHGRRGLAGGGRLQLGDRHAGHFEEQVDAVEERAGELAAVAGDLVRRASTATVGRAVVAARAGVHRRDELEAGRELGPFI